MKSTRQYSSFVWFFVIPECPTAFLLGEVSDYFGSWISETLEQTANCNNGKIIKVENTDVKRRSITVLSRPELDMLVADGFKPVGYNLQIFRSSGTK